MQKLSLLNLSVKQSRTTRTFQEKEFTGRLMANKSILGTKGLLLELGVHQVHIQTNAMFFRVEVFGSDGSLLWYMYTVPDIDVDTKGGKTVGYVYVGERLAGVFNLSDACRSGVSQAIKELKSLGIKTAMLTGDNQAAAMHAQEQVSNLFLMSLMLSLETQ